MSLFLLGSNVADDEAIFDFSVLEEFMPVDKATSVSSLYLPDPVEKSFNFI